MGPMTTGNQTVSDSHNKEWESDTSKQVEFTHLAITSELALFD